MAEKTKLLEKLKDWHIEDISVLALYESAHALGLLDELGLTEDQHLHGLSLIMALWLIAKSLYERRKKSQGV